MEETNTNPVEQVQGAATNAEQEQEQAEQAQEQAKQEQEQEPTQEVDPQIRKLRDENAKHRTKARDAEKHAEELQGKFDNFLKGLNQLLGNEPEDTETDPEKIIAAAQEREQQWQKRYQSMAQRVALADAVAAAGADPDLTIPYIKGTDAFGDLDPSSEDYAAQVTALVKETVGNVPKLRAQVAPPSSGNTATPSDNSVETITREDLKRMSASEINKLSKQGRLNHLFKK